MAKRTTPALDAARDAIRNPYAWPGGYAKRIYLEDGEAICTKCAKSEWRQLIYSSLAFPDSHLDGWGVQGVDVHWEGPPEYCVHCSKELPSEYGGPGAPEEEE